MIKIVENKIIFEGDFVINGEITEQILEAVELNSDKDIEINFENLSLKLGDDILIQNKNKVELAKVLIDFGDSSLPLVSSNNISKSLSTIIKAPKPWKNISHKIVLQTGYDYVNENKFELNISFFALSGHVYKVKIPYVLLFKGLQVVGTEFDLLAANIRNDNRISYVLKHKNTDSIISVVTK